MTVRIKDVRLKVLPDGGVTPFSKADLPNDAQEIMPPAPDIYIVHQGEQVMDYAWKCAELLRDQGCDVILHCGGGSFKSQMKKADASGASYALIIGDDEFKAQEVTLKPLREAIEQASVKLDIVTEIINKKSSQYQ